MRHDRKQANPRLALTFLTGLLFVTGFGCTDPAKDNPKVFAATGIVKFKDGRPVANASVKFAGNKDNEYSVGGSTKDDGTFSLVTIVLRNTQKPLQGAPEGDYEVTVILPFAEDQSGGQQIKVDSKYTVKAQDNNNFAITIAAPKK